MAASLETFKTTAPRPSRAEEASAPNSFCQPEWAQDVRPKGELQSFALGIRQQGEACRPKIRGAIDENVKPSKHTENLNRDGMNVILLRNVAAHGALLIAVQDLVTGLSGNTKFPAQGRHAFPVLQSDHEAHAFVHNRIFLPWHPPPPAFLKGKKIGRASCRERV